MADALLILTKNNPSQALHDHQERQFQTAQDNKTTPENPTRRQQARNTSTTTQHAETNATGSNVEPDQYRAPSDQPLSESGRTETTQQNPTVRPKLFSVRSPLSPSPSPKPAIDYDEDPFPEIGDTTNHFIDRDEDMREGTHSDDSDRHDRDRKDRYRDRDREDSEKDQATSGEDNENIETRSSRPSNDPERDHLEREINRQVVVQRADTRVIIHWSAQAGEVNYENGPPIDHPRLMALLCDAQIDVQHCDADGLPTGLITTAHHSSWRQDRYLAFRDGPCRIPECEGIGKTQAHHIFEDRIDRVTSVEYMINFCNRCHQEHHDGNFTITGKPEQTITFTYKDGTQLASTARPRTNKLKAPKPIPLSKHRTEVKQADVFATSA